MNERVVFFHVSFILVGETVNKHTNKHCLVKSVMEENVNSVLREMRRDKRHS